MSEHHGNGQTNYPLSDAEWKAYVDDPNLKTRGRLFQRRSIAGYFELQAKA